MQRKLKPACLLIGLRLNIISQRKRINKEPKVWVYAQRLSRFPTTVVFLVPAVPASIYKVSEDIIVNEGSNVTLTCFANGRPEPAISWRLLNPSGKAEKASFTAPAASGCAPSLAPPAYVDICGGKKFTSENPNVSLRCEWWRRSRHYFGVMKNSSIFTDYCVKHQCCRHILSTPSVSCTWKLSDMDGCASPPLSVYIIIIGLC